MLMRFRIILNMELTIDFPKYYFERLLVRRTDKYSTTNISVISFLIDTYIFIKKMDYMKLS